MGKAFAILLTLHFTVYGQTAAYLNLSFGGLFVAGISTLDEPNLDIIQGGAHDPKKRGFTVQNLELSMTGAVDPWFYAETHLIFQIDPEGESILEVEEAFMVTNSMPFGLQVKAGTFFTEFGRLNPQHPHVWSFVDQPIINNRLFGGDGLRGPGVRLSWLTPLTWYSELITGIQNANGETMVSFLASDEVKTLGEYSHIDRKVQSMRDVLWSSRWLNSFSPMETITANLGVSGLWGPNRAGQKTQTSILGMDIYAKWKPLTNNRGFPFVAFQAEVLSRFYEVIDSTAIKTKLETVKDQGYYGQVLWGFKLGWVLGFKVENVWGKVGQTDDPVRGDRTRWASNLTWYPSEFSKLRLNYNLEKWEDQGQLQTDHSLWIQFEFLIGQHGGHKF